MSALDPDQLTRKWTAFADFQQLLAGGHDAAGAPVETSYRPSLYPGRSATQEDVAELRRLADGYDAAQTLRGDARRAYRGNPSYWTPAAPRKDRPPKPTPQKPIKVGKARQRSFADLRRVYMAALARLAECPPAAQLNLPAMAARAGGAE